MHYLTFTFDFNAFHKMWNSTLPKSDNEAIFGKCSNSSGHGHCYRLEITVKGTVSGDKPFLISNREIDRVKTRVLEQKLAYSNLNKAFGSNFISSGENIAKEVWEILVSEFDAGTELSAVKVIETRKNSFIYRKDVAVLP